MTRNRHDREDGFTLIELMTVVMVIAVLIAIAIPSFFRAKQPAQDRQAQTLLRTSLTATRAIATERGDLSAVDIVTTLPAAEPTISFVDASTTAQATAKGVSVGTGVGYVILASRSTSGRCFAVLERDAAAPAFQRVDTAGCTAAQFDPVVGWAAEWP